METVYLDNAATTPLDPEVLAAMLPCMREHFANPSSAHPPGQKARSLIDGAREKTAAALGGKSKGVIFTSGGSEANNLAIRGLVHGCGDAGGLRGKRIIITRLEHPSVSEAAAILARSGFNVVSPSNDSSGRIDLNHLEDLLREEPTALAAVIHGSNEVGTLQDAGRISGLLRAVSPRTWFHLDVVQSIGYVPLRAGEIGADSLAISAHKLHGPKGAGILALFRDAPIVPLIAGGGQEGNRRSGTENTAAIVGAAEALARAVAARESRAAHTAALREKLRLFISANIADARFNGAEEETLPHILSVSFPGLLGEVLLHHLETEGVMVSAGSACHATQKTLSATLKALGIPTRLAQGTIRFSFSHCNRPEEVDHAADALKRHVAYLREVGLP
jgi:cysteine desulfurase